MLDRGDDDPAAAGVLRDPPAVEAEHREVVGLGAAGGDDDLRWPGPEHARDLLAALLEPAPGLTPAAVQGGGVSELGELGAHRRDRLREHGGRRSVVQIHASRGHGAESRSPGRRSQIRDAHPGPPTGPVLAHFMDVHPL